jgi:hypothetical protein
MMGHQKHGNIRKAVFEMIKFCIVSQSVGKQQQSNKYQAALVRKRANICTHHSKHKRIHCKTHLV